MSSWNYRVVHRKHIGRTPEFDEDSYAIHEVYYDDNGKMRAVSKEPAPAYAEDLQGLDWVLRKFREAYEKDVVEWDSIPEKGSKPFGVQNDTLDNEEPLGITPDGE
jgi:hypothetical protein